MEAVVEPLKCARCAKGKGRLWDAGEETGGDSGAGALRVSTKTIRTLILFKTVEEVSAG